MNLIFGVAYHVIPRFSGHPLHSRGMAGAHFWVANAGLTLMVSGWLIRASWYGTGAAIVNLGAATSAVGAFLFIHNLWRTLGAPKAPLTSLSRERALTPSGTASP
ncbi:MAG: hypothetical protein H0U67_04355 [Gemmatimonadetes bacterium]|nr:hypothetical protein [Gemmatimonadota bacterium]